MMLLGVRVVGAPAAASRAPSRAPARPHAAPTAHVRINNSARGNRSRMNVVCMAQPRRVARVASQIKREIGEMLAYDEVMQSAISPNRKLGDDQLSAVASVTEVYVANDLQFVRVYVSIYSDEKGKKKAMENLKKLEPYVRREIGQRVSLRLTPEVRFEYDDMIEEMELVEKVIGKSEIDRLKAEMGIDDDDNDASAGDPAGGELDEMEEGGEDDEDEEFEEGEEEDGWSEPPPGSTRFKGPFDDLFVGDDEGPLVQERGVSYAGYSERQRQQQQQRQQRGRGRGAGGAAAARATEGGNGRGGAGRSSAQQGRGPQGQ